MSTFKNKNRGFSLLESMVAITILLVAVVGPLSTIGDSLSQIYIARDQMVAINLAQEGIEAVRQIRDSNMIKGWNEGTRTTDWDTGLTEGYYYVNATSDGFALDSSVAAGVVIEQDPNSGTYGNSGVDTKFRRVIQVEPVIDSPDEIKITSTVLWKTSGGTEKRIDVIESLFGINTTP